MKSVLSLLRCKKAMSFQLMVAAMETLRDVNSGVLSSNSSEGRSNGLEMYKLVKDGRLQSLKIESEMKERPPLISSEMSVLGREICDVEMGSSLGIALAMSSKCSRLGGSHEPSEKSSGYGKDTPNRLM